MEERGMMVEVIATTKCYPSEDLNKVIQAMKNVINADLKINDNNVIGIANGKDALRTIYEQARARKILGVLNKKLWDNLSEDTTWIYINKQAAYVGIIVICDDANESPLGPIKIEIRSKNINDVIEWLTKGL